MNTKEATQLAVQLAIADQIKAAAKQVVMNNLAVLIYYQIPPANVSVDFNDDETNDDN
jgi:hypothetical protein